MCGLLSATAEALLWPFGIRRRRAGQGGGEDGADRWEVDPVHFVGATTGMLIAWWAFGRTKSSTVPMLDASPAAAGATRALPRIPLSEFLRLLKAGAVTAVTYFDDRSPAGALVLQAAVPATVAAATAAVMPSALAGATGGKPAAASATTIIMAETLLMPGSHQKVFDDLHRCSGVHFECAETSPAGMDSDYSKLSFLMDVGGLIACGISLWYIMKGNSNQASVTGKRLEDTHRDGDRHPVVTFEDVAGMENTKEELREVISFLRNPQGYYALGARPPRGLLLAGPSGTGKTLLARAVAGEAGVPFLYASAAAFVEVYVGQGAQRIRQFYDQARACAPCIVFLDELDSVGASRQAGSTGGNQEYAQTLNQLLLELDGVESHSSETGRDQPLVVTMAATNRYDCLDEALVRPGRLDRIVLVQLPNLAEREATLRIHARKLQHEGLDFAILARRTQGASGADLANALNEAALLAARRGADAVRMEHVLEVLGNPRPQQRGSPHRGQGGGMGAGGGGADTATLTPQELFAGMCTAMAAMANSGGAQHSRPGWCPPADAGTVD